MTSEALPIGQIITVLIFLASLLAALYFVRRHGTGLRQHFTAARRANRQRIVTGAARTPAHRSDRPSRICDYFGPQRNAGFFCVARAWCADAIPG